MENRRRVALRASPLPPSQAAPPTLGGAPPLGDQSQQQAAAPALQLSPSLARGGGGGGSPPPGGSDDSNSLQDRAKVLWRRLLIDLSSLPRAIALMAATFGFSALGTFVPQNKGLDYYMLNYPEDGDKVLGFIDYTLIYALDLDHIYSAWYFYLTLGWLAASLIACTTTRQWPAVRVAQRWRFQTTPVGVAKQGVDGKGIAEVLPSARVRDLGLQLQGKGYQVFLKDASLYAFKGLAGKVGPIGVHAALLLTMAGAAYSGFGGFKGTIMLPEGEDVVLSQVLQPVSPIAVLPSGASAVLHVNGFNIDYRPDGQVAQFYSDLSVLDPARAPTAEQLERAQRGADKGQEAVGVAGREMLRKTISVNDPFRYNGLTMYQTDWSLSSVGIRVLGPVDAASPASSSSPASASEEQDPVPSTSAPASRQQPQERGSLVMLPMASLEGRPGINGRLWGSYLPVASASDAEVAQGKAPRGVSILARDPQAVIFYDAKGQFAGVRRPDSGKPIEVEGVRLVVEKVVGATGLEIKNDPGVPLVYAGFGGLMVTVLVSYLSHSQVWAVQEGTTLYVGGRSNRALLGFRKEMNEVLDAIPEAALPASSSTTSA